MLREQCQVGMTVTFGRAAGEKTVGVVVKCNPTKAKVQTTEARGRTPAGAIWSVSYSLLTAEGIESPKPTAPAQGFPVGLRIDRVRSLTAQELQAEGWDGDATAIELSDGSVLYASQDYEGNGPGAFFGRLRTGEHFTVG